MHKLACAVCVRLNTIERVKPEAIGLRAHFTHGIAKFDTLLTYYELLIIANGCIHTQLPAIAWFLRITWSSVVWFYIPPLIFLYLYYTYVAGSSDV